MGKNRGKRAEKVVEKGRELVYNVWTSKRFGKKRCGVSRGQSFKVHFLKEESTKDVRKNKEGFLREYHE